MELDRSLPREDTARRRLSATLGRALTRIGPCWHLDLGSTVSRTVKKCMSVVQGTQATLICSKTAGYDSLPDYDNLLFYLLVSWVIRAHCTK